MFKPSMSHDQYSTMPIYGKTFKNLLQNQLTDGLETWNGALGTQNNQYCSNDDLGLTLTYFTAGSNMEKY